MNTAWRCRDGRRPSRDRPLTARLGQWQRRSASIVNAYSIGEPRATARSDSPRGGRQWSRWWPGRALPLRERADDLLRRLTTDEKIAMLHQYVARRAPARDRAVPHRHRGAARRRLARPRHGLPAGRRAGRDLGPGPGPAVGAAVARGGAGAAPPRPGGEPERLGAGGQPAPGPPVGPQRGRLLGGPAADRADCRRLLPPACAAAIPCTCGPRRCSSTSWRTTTRPPGRPPHRRCGPRVLHEYELPPFHAPVAAGVAVGVMPSYNLVNGRPNHVSPYLERELRRWPAASGRRRAGGMQRRGRPVQPGGHRALLRRPSGGPRRRAAGGVDSFTDHGADSSRSPSAGSPRRWSGACSPWPTWTARCARLLLLRLRLGEVRSGPRPVRRYRRGLDRHATGDGSIRPAVDDRSAWRAWRTANWPAGPPGRPSSLLKNDEGAAADQAAAGLRIAVVGPFADTAVRGLVQRHDALPGHGRWPAGGGEAAGRRVVRTEGTDRVALVTPGAGAGAAVRVGGRRGPGAGRRGHAGPSAGRWASQRRAAGVRACPRRIGDSRLGWGGNVITLRSSVTGRYLTVKDDDSLAADADRPNGWVVRETFALREPTGATRRSPAFARAGGLTAPGGRRGASARRRHRALPGRGRRVRRRCGPRAGPAGRSVPLGRAAGRDGRGGPAAARRRPRRGGGGQRSR